MVRKSKAVARELGIGYDRLSNLIRSGRLDPPAKDESGDYVWGPEDIERARQAMRIDRRRRKAVAHA